MSALEFDEFYHKAFPVGIFGLYNSLSNDYQSFAAEFDRNQIYCPECKICQLKLSKETSSRKAYLSKMPGEKNHHASWCRHNHKIASKITQQRFYRRLSNAEIQKRLSKVMEYLFITSRNTQIKTIPTYENHPLLGYERTAGKPEKYFRLLKRSFYTIYNLPKEELDRPLLLYGDDYKKH